MFFTFLNKENAHYLDLAVIRRYPPDKILFYYYNSAITFPLDTYLELLDTVDKEKPRQYLTRWFNLLEGLDVTEDMEFFEHNEFLTKIGPYYYPETNSRIYFTKETISPDKFLTVEDMEVLTTLQNYPAIAKEIQTYYKSRKNAKKTAKNKEDLLKDIDICLKSFAETEILGQHINFINKLLDSRYSIVEQINLEPMEPDNIPIKPQAVGGNVLPKDNIIPFSKIKRKSKNEISVGNTFNYDTKVYFIRYREYEKACDRYKLILSDWPNLYLDFLDKSYQDIDENEAKLEKANSALNIYNYIIHKSYVHADYQDLATLEKFKSFLETGRANNLQDCMNLFEDEKYWKDIRASQDRIENTIYFLQSETDLTRFADENISKYLQQFNETAAHLEELND
ncbi:MAG TPA: hypothetical protein VFD02_07155 [Syntrophomonadaceae bacterium]|nr:hypothetical protein [Syntrophomonadaceae bacterium]